MKQYLVDSDILMDFFKKQEYAISLLDKLLDSGVVTTSILSISELRAGWDNDQAQNLLPMLYRMTEIKNLSQKIAELGGKFKWEYKAKGVTLSVVDTLIAATAILEKCELVTRNKKDFLMPKLKFHKIEE